jgi:hypothetical protein
VVPPGYLETHCGLTARPLPTEEKEAEDQASNQAPVTALDLVRGLQRCGCVVVPRASSGWEDAFPRFLYWRFQHSGEPPQSRVIIPGVFRAFAQPALVEFLE